MGNFGHITSLLSEYDFEIKHIKGKENKVADTLIRHANMLYVTASRRYEIDLEDQNQNTTKFNKYYKKLKEKKTENEERHVKT